MTSTLRNDPTMPDRHAIAAALGDEWTDASHHDPDTGEVYP